jgi:hypothetical protein
MKPIFSRMRLASIVVFVATSTASRTPRDNWTSVATRLAQPPRQNGLRQNSSNFEVYDNYDLTGP